MVVIHCDVHIQPDGSLCQFAIIVVWSACAACGQEDEQDCPDEYMDMFGHVSFIYWETNVMKIQIQRRGRLGFFE